MNKQPEVTAATRKRIIDAFWKEYKEKPIAKITISSITKSAGIHRSTFYEYFKDIYDVLEQLETDLLEQLKIEFLPIFRKNVSRLKDDTLNDLNEFIGTTLSFFTTYGDLLYHLSGSSGNPAFRKKLYKLFKANFTIMHEIPENSPHADYFSAFIFAVIMNNLEYWFEHQDSISMKEVITLSYKLLGDGLKKGFLY